MYNVKVLIDSPVSLQSVHDISNFNLNVRWMFEVANFLFGLVKLSVYLRSDTV